MVYMKRLTDGIVNDGFVKGAISVKGLLVLTLILIDLYYLILSWFIFDAGRVILELDLVFRDIETNTLSVN